MPSPCRRSMSFSLAIASMWVVGPVAAQTPAAGVPTAATLSRSLEATASEVGPSVVQIFATSYSSGEGLVPGTAELVTTQRASGSGVIVDRSGYIVTNAHVVRGAWRLRVEVPMPPKGESILSARSRTLGAQMVGLDLETDLAVIKVNGGELPALSFGDSEELKPGQLVLAVGSPLGLQNSVSIGVVSAVARQLEPDSPMIYVQTDAAISPGSSGGPLVDMRGRLVGVNTLIASQAGGSEGIGFATPSNIVRTVFEQIRDAGRVRRGEIGVRAQTISPVMAAGLRLTRSDGAIVADVAPGSPAARAGLRPGDLILAVDGKPMENGRQFHVNLYRRRVGERVTLDVLRDTETLKASVEIAERADPMAGLSASADPRQNLVPRLGVLALDLDARVAGLLPVVRARSGAVIASTVAGALDSRDGGLAPGDVVYAVNRAPVAGVAELRTLLAAFKPGDPVVLQLERAGRSMYLTFTVE